MTSRWSEENYTFNMGGGVPIPPMVPPMLPPVLPSGLMEDLNGGSMMQPPIVMPGPTVMPPSVNQDVGERSMDIAATDEDSLRDRGSRGRHWRESGTSRGAERSRRRSRSPRDRHSRDTGDRNQDRDRRDRNRDRRSKWDSAERNTARGGNSENSIVPDAMVASGMQSGLMQAGGMPNMMMAGQGGPGMMMQYPAGMFNNNMMGQQQMDLQGNMMGMQNMMGMPNMMMDQNMMSQMYPMNQMMSGMMGTQPIYVTNAVLMPPAPGTSLPQRRDKPPGCRTVFIGGLPNDIKDATIREIFQRFGTITDLKLSRKGFCHVRFQLKESVEASFSLSGYRFKYQDQMDSDACNIFIDYALNRDDQNEHEKSKRNRSPTPPRIEPFSPANLSIISEKIKSEEHFADAAPTLAGWLERGECNKKNAQTFYSLIQATNNHIRRLFNEKMNVDEELSNMKTSLRDKFLHIINQFEQVAKIFAASKIQRVWDHFSKQQRKNIEMWQKMTGELDTMKEEFNTNFDEDDEKPGKKMVSEDKYEELKRENDNLAYELEGYKNQAMVAMDEAERKFEKFKAHFVAQQALQGNKAEFLNTPQPPPPPQTLDTKRTPQTGPSVPPTEARLISVITAFLLVHPLGASVDYIVSYVRSMMPKTTQSTVSDVLRKYSDVFAKKTSGVGASIEHKWTFITYDNIRQGSLE